MNEDFLDEKDARFINAMTSHQNPKWIAFVRELISKKASAETHAAVVKALEEHDALLDQARKDEEG